MTQALINIPSYYDQLHVSGPATLNSAYRLPDSIAGTSRRKLAFSLPSSRNQTYAETPRRRIPAPPLNLSREPPADSHAEQRGEG